MRVVLADTGPLYALVDVDDQYHARARREAARLEGAGYHVAVAYPTLTESYTLVLHRLGTRTALRWLAEVSAGVDLFNALPQDYDEAIARAQRFDDQVLTLTDLILGVLSERLSAPVWTFDADFDVMGISV